MDRWRGKVAVVTGASEGIGEAIVRRLASQEYGMKVAALARRKELLQELERDVNDNGGGIVRGYKCDVSSTDDLEKTFRSLQQDFGPVHVLINNAAVLKNINLADVDLDAVEAIVNTNLMGVIKSCQQAISSMKTNGIHDGHIINISSMAVYMDTKDWPEYGMYATTKCAVNKFSKSLKDQLVKEGYKTRVTVVCPGLVKTSMVNDIISKYSEVPHLLPEDIADSVIYVLSAPARVKVSEILINPS